MVEPNSSGDERDEKRQYQTNDDYADERPIKNLVDWRSRHKDKKSWRQGKVENKTVKGSGRVRPKHAKVPRNITRQYDAKDRKDDIYKGVHERMSPRELASHRTSRTGETRSDCLLRVNSGRACPRGPLDRLFSVSV